MRELRFGAMEKKKYTSGVRKVMGGGGSPPLRKIPQKKCFSSVMASLSFSNSLCNFPIVLPRCLFGSPNSHSTSQLLCQGACLEAQIAYSTSQLFCQGASLVSQIASQLPNCSVKVLVWFLQIASQLPNCSAKGLVWFPK